MITSHRLFFFFFFNDTATTEIYTLSLHDALPISQIDAITESGKKRRHARALGADEALASFLQVGAVGFDANVLGRVAADVRLVQRLAPCAGRRFFFARADEPERVAARLQTSAEPQAPRALAQLVERKPVD